jgi:lysyl-tRNA synthetase class 1
LTGGEAHALPRALAGTIDEQTDMNSDRELAQAAKAWPFEEARALLARLGGKVPEKGYVLFETGYGPSGLPHIGTFGEVVRTTMVRQAFARLSDIPTRLFCFSDDMDGLRKVPDNVPNQEMLREHLGRPLTAVPDPFGKFDSFGAHNNAMLRRFLDGFGFQYEFQSATAHYKAGTFDATLLRVLERFDAVMGVMLPTLGPERRESYSPFLPISPKSGRVLQVPTLERHVSKGTIVFEDEDGEKIETPVTGGRVKLQWKPDWAMRWTALGVDYEMSGKDLIDSVKQSSAIARAIGGTPPQGFTYELFLDETGQKISKSKGNGLTVDEWLRYAPPESLALFMYQQPKRAKRLYFDVIPKAVDEYLSFVKSFSSQDAPQRLENPAWAIHNGTPPVSEVPLTFGILLNLASVVNAEEKSVLWGFISRYVPGASPSTAPLLDKLADYAVAYYQDFVKPTKQYRAPNETERAALADLDGELAKLAEGAEAEAIQTQVYEVGKRHAFPALKDWFAALYATLLGQNEGPRMGSFIALYGVAETRALIAQALAGKLVKA